MGTVAAEAFIVSTWTKPGDDPARRTGLWRLELETDPVAALMDDELSAIYWATAEPARSSLLLLNNDEERSSLLRWTPATHDATVPRWSSGGVGGSYLAFHPEGRHFVVANSGAGWSLFRTGDTPAPLVTVMNSGQGPHPRQATSHPHCAIFSADGRWMYAADMGTDEVLAFPFDASTEQLGEVVRSHRAAPGAGPRHLLEASDVIYLLNELDSTVEVLRPRGDGTLDAAQRLSTLPADFSGESYAAHLGTSPDGCHLYATNRGHDSIAHFTIADDGSLTIRDWVLTGGWPWHFQATRDGRLLVANNQSDEVAIYTIDQGRLRAAGSVPIPRPVFIAPEPATPTTPAPSAA